MWKIKLSSKGQVVIPKEIREKLGLKKGDVLSVRLEEDRIILEPISPPPPHIFIEAGEEIIEKLLKEAKSTSDKAERLLRDLGIE